MRRLVALLLIAGCAGAEPQAAAPPNDSPLITTAPSLPVARIETAPPPPPPPPPVLIVLPPDTCGARPLQGLVGQPRTTIPAPIDPSRRRVYCTTCPVTQDLRADRLNIVFDADSGVITEVKCG